MDPLEWIELSIKKSSAEQDDLIQLRWNKTKILSPNYPQFDQLSSNFIILLR
jgi:hypothetical protein